MLGDDLAQVLGRDDEVHGHALRRAADQGRLVVLHGAHHGRARRAHRVGEEYVTLPNVPSDLGVVPRRPDHLALLVRLAAHEEVVLPHQGRVEDLVHQVEDDLGGVGPRTGDADRDRLGGPRQREAAVDRLGVGRYHAGRHVDSRPGQLGREDDPCEHLVQRADEAAGVGLARLRRGEAGEQRPRERVVDQVYGRPVTVGDLGHFVAALGVGDFDHRFFLLHYPPRDGVWLRRGPGSIRSRFAVRLDGAASGPPVHAGLASETCEPWTRARRAGPVPRKRREAFGG